MTKIQQALNDVADCISTYIEVLQSDDDGTHSKRCIDVLSILNDCVVSLHAANASSDSGTGLDDE